MIELSNQELKGVDGGLPFWQTVGAGIFIGAALAIINDWNNFERGFNGEPYYPR